MTSFPALAAWARPVAGALKVVAAKVAPVFVASAFVVAVFVVATLIAGCARAPLAAPVSDPIELRGTYWRLVDFRPAKDTAGPAVIPRVERYTLAFGQDGTLATGLDCNRATARWQAGPASASGAALTITPGPVTRAWCGEGAIDSRLARDLARVRSFTIAGDRLHLELDADGGTYVWERSSR